MLVKIQDESQENIQEFDNLRKYCLVKHIQSSQIARKYFSQRPSTGSSTFRHIGFQILLWKTFSSNQQ